MKIDFKKWLSFTLAIIVILSITGCSDSAKLNNDSLQLSSIAIESNTQGSTVVETTTEPYTKPTTAPTTAKPTEKPTEPIVGSGKAEVVNLSSLPDYSGTAYIVINDNQPNFSSSELTAKGYERYSSLDSLGRCGVAIACCGREIMPADGEERGSISSIKPTGWVQAKYKGISGGYLWNRCHLIGWQLSAENANRSNLITGTRYMNIEGMLTFENMVADYIKETDNHVAYRVTPVFEGDNLVCSGVQMEAYSIEDNGEGICFNVYCYNVQPGISIDYATGNSSGPSAEAETKPPKVEEPENNNNYESDNNSTMVWIPRTGSKYHSDSDCSNMKNPEQVTQDAAESRGYEPCKKCY